LTVLPLVAIGVFEAALALSEAATGDTVDGTYWNRNHLAGLLEMVLPFTVAWALFARRKAAGEKPPARLRAMLKSLLRGAVPMVSIVVIFGGVVASGSKMGYTAMLFGLLAMALAAVVTRLSGAAKWAGLAAIPVIGIIAFAQLGNQDVLLRIESAVATEEGMTGEGRLPIWADSLRLLAANPVFGSGLGTYAAAFFSYQTTGLGNHWTHAHNDYVEFATDLGAAGFLIFGGLMVLVVIRAARLVAPGRGSGADLVALGSIGALAAMGLHSVVDFNLQVPANALVLAWILGVAAGITPPSRASGESERRVVLDRRNTPRRDSVDRRAWLRPRQVFPIALACVAIVMSAVAIAKGPPSEPQTFNDRLDAVRQSPASPYAWLDVAEGFAASGRQTEASASIANALHYGPNLPLVHRRSATLLDAAGDRSQAVELMLRDVKSRGGDTVEVFNWFAERRMPAADVVAGLANDNDALSAYLRYLMLPGTCREAALAWRELLARHRPDGRLAGGYVNFVQSDCQGPDAATEAWIQYARAASPEYLVSNWVFNGGFEHEPVPNVRFDWQWNRRNDQAGAARDAALASAGSQSLRMVFRGASAASYDGAWQTIPVTPGTYRFSAAVRTSGLNSAEGIRFRIFGSGSGKRVEVVTGQATGTSEWHTITTEAAVPEGVTQLRIQIVRRPGPAAEKEDALTGTAWVDAVTLSKIG
jgi:O-antigen ligase